MNEMEWEAIRTKCRKLVGLSNYILNDKKKFDDFVIEVQTLYDWVKKLESSEGGKN